MNTFLKTPAPDYEGLAAIIREQAVLLRAQQNNRGRLKDELLEASGALARGEYQKASGLLDAIIGNL